MDVAAGGEVWVEGEGGARVMGLSGRKVDGQVSSVWVVNPTKKVKRTSRPRPQQADPAKLPSLPDGSPAYPRLLLPRRRSPSAPS